MPRSSEGDRQIADALTLAPIEPTMLCALAEIHLAAFDGYMNARLGPPYARAFLDWFRRFERGIALAASAHGEPLGYVVGAPTGYQAQLSKDLFWVVLRRLLGHPSLLLASDLRSALTQRMAARLGLQRRRIATPELPEPSYSLVGIGVSPAARGRGVGRSLVAAFEIEAARLGARSVRLSVYSNNAAARRLYERAAWTLLSDDSQPVCYYGRHLR